MGNYLELRKYADGTVAVVNEAPEDHAFSEKYISKGLAEGWISMDKGVIVLDTDPPLRYAIVRGPGRYDDDSDPDHKYHGDDKHEIYHDYVVKLEA